MTQVAVFSSIELAEKKGILFKFFAMREGFYEQWVERFISARVNIFSSVIDNRDELLIKISTELDKFFRDTQADDYFIEGIEYSHDAPFWSYHEKRWRMFSFFHAIYEVARM